ESAVSILNAGHPWRSHAWEFEYLVGDAVRPRRIDKIYKLRSLDPLRIEMTARFPNGLVREKEEEFVLAFPDALAAQAEEREVDGAANAAAPLAQTLIDLLRILTNRRAGARKILYRVQARRIALEKETAVKVVSAVLRHN